MFYLSGAKDFFSTILLHTFATALFFLLFCPIHHVLNTASLLVSSSHVLQKAQRNCGYVLGSGSHEEGVLFTYFTQFINCSCVEFGHKEIHVLCFLNIVAKKCFNCSGCYGMGKAVECCQSCKYKTLIVHLKFWQLKHRKRTKKGSIAINVISLLCPFV